MLGFLLLDNEQASIEIDLGLAPRAGGSKLRAFPLVFVRYHEDRYGTNSQFGIRGRIRIQSNRTL